MNKTDALVSLLQKVEAGDGLEKMYEVPQCFGSFQRSTQFMNAYRVSLDAAKALIVAEMERESRSVKS